MKMGKAQCLKVLCFAEWSWVHYFNIIIGTAIESALCVNNSYPHSASMTTTMSDGGPVEGKGLIIIFASLSAYAFLFACLAHQN